MRRTLLIFRVSHSFFSSNEIGSLHCNFSRIEDQHFLSIHGFMPALFFPEKILSSRQLSEVGVKETSFEANRQNVNSLFLV